MKPAIPLTMKAIPLDWERMVPALSRANRAIARFDGMLAHLQNPELLMAPLTTREAVLSSKIEGTVVTVGEMFRYDAGEEPIHESKRLDFEEVTNYRTALEAAKDDLAKRGFCLNLVLKLHKILLTSVRGQNKAPGQFRRLQNHIGRPGSSLDEAEFVPPAPSELMSFLGDWESYYHSEEKDVLVQLALVHAQFEFLHPFLDGNGRLGRIFIPIFLFDKQVLASPTFYLSEYLDEHRDRYIQHLRDLKAGDDSWTSWCLFFLEAMTEQADRNVEKAKAILQLYGDLKSALLDLPGSSSAVPVLDAMFSQPIFVASSLLPRKGVPPRPKLMRQLGSMVDRRILTVLAPASGSRPAVYSLHQLVTLCDDQPRKRVARKRVHSGVTVTDARIRR